MGAAAPWLGERLAALTSLDEVKLLSVQLSRLRKWWAPGLLVIGDAAHAMSPVGGVGINLAIQDAVATARLVGARLRRGPVRSADLARVQLRRWPAAAAIQTAQRLIHRRFATGAEGSVRPRVPRPGLRLLSRAPVLQRVLAYLVAVGPRPERSPTWARRTSRSGDGPAPAPGESALLRRGAAPVDASAAGG